MGSKAKVNSSSDPGNYWSTLIVTEEMLKSLVETIRESSQPPTTHSLATRLAGQLSLKQGSTKHPKLKRYDHRCDYEEGERVYMDNRYGRSIATITKIIRQPKQAFCDKAFFQFDDDAYRTCWEEERSTPYFAINSGRTNADPVYVNPVTGKTVPAPQMPSTAEMDRLERLLYEALSSDSQFVFDNGCWTAPLKSQSKTADPGDDLAPLPQGLYKKPILEVIDRMGTATIDEIKKTVRAQLEFSAADQVVDKTGKIVWIHRLHAAIKHLKRVGAITSPARQTYCRIPKVSKQTS